MFRSVSSRKTWFPLIQHEAGAGSERGARQPALPGNLVLGRCHYRGAHTTSDASGVMGRGLGSILLFALGSNQV